jgi:hypothetical protein
MLAATAACAQPVLTPDQQAIWTISGENDSISTTPGGSDKYYTSGLRLGWTSGANQVPVAISDFATGFWGDGVTRVSFDLSQQIFTPSNIHVVLPNPNDRPVAAYLAGTFAVLHDTASHRDVLALSVGVIGPFAFGRQVQNGFHELIRDRINQGWGGQLPNEPAVELLAERTWRVPLATLGGLQTDMLPSATAGLGTVRDYAQAGAVFRFGQHLDSDFGVARMRPGITGGDAFSATTEVPWYIFVGFDGQVVARDALLDGDIWRRSARVGHTWLLGEMQAGVAIIWHGARISYTQTWQTASFHGQRGGLFNFGSLTASIRL